MFCSNCGSKLSEGARFCSVCGQKVVSLTEPEEKRAEIEFPAEPAAEVAVSRPAEAPMKTRVTFDWSNVIDEPQRKTNLDIKSPWAATGGMDEKELFSEMSPSSSRSRTMSFIDILKAEKEEKEREREREVFPPEYAATERFPGDPSTNDLVEEVSFPDKAADDTRYTEVLDRGYLNGSESAKGPELHTAPLLQDPDEPVVTPFDEQPEPRRSDSYERSSESSSWDEVPAFLRNGRDNAAFEKKVAPVTRTEIDIPDIIEEIGTAVPERAVKAEEPAAPERTALTEEPAAPEQTIKTEEPAAVEIPEDADGADYQEERSPEDVYTSKPEDLYAYDEMETAPVERRGREKRNEALYAEDAAADDAEAADDTREFGETIPQRVRAAEEPETYDEIPEYEDVFFEDASKDADLDFIDDYLRGEDTEGIDENELFNEMEETRKPSGMTIAAPADRESEIEELKRRLAELMGETVNETASAAKAEPAADAVPAAETATAAETASSAETASEAGNVPVVEVAEAAGQDTPIDDILAAVLASASEPAAGSASAAEPAAAEPAAETPVREIPLSEIPGAAAREAEAAVQASADMDAYADSLDAETGMPDIYGSLSDTEADISAEKEAVRESDALSLEDIERDLLGGSQDGSAEAEATKKIDKFYTLYRKNEEFQKLLDEEYNKLKSAGGPAPEPVLKDEEVPSRPVEDATIYQPLERPLEELAAETSAGTAKASDETELKRPILRDASAAGITAVPVAAVAADAAATAEAKTPGPEVEYEEEDKGGVVLTILAVVIALILVFLLAVILIVDFMPDSGAAVWIRSIIENITSHFTAIDAGVYLL